MLLEIPVALTTSSVTWAISTNLNLSLTLNLTAEQEAATTRAMLEKAKARHMRLVKELIPQVLPSNPDELVFQESVTDHTALLLTRYREQLILLG